MAAKEVTVIPKKYLDIKQFDKELKKNIHRKICVFFDTDNTDINDYLDIYKNALEISEQNIYVYTGAEFDIPQFINAYSTQPLFSEKRLFIVKDINACPQKRFKQLTERFYEVISEDIEDTFLIVTNEKVSDNKITEFLKNIIKNLYFFFAKEQSPEQWTMDYAQKNNRDIDYNAVKKLINLCSSKTSYIKNELDKIFLYALDSKLITEEIINKTVQNYDENDIFKFINTLLYKQYDKAVSQYRQLLNQKQNINGIIYNLTEKINKLIYFIEASKKMKTPDPYKIGELVLKEHRIMLNYHEKNEFLKIKTKYDEQSLKKNLKLLIDIDAISKSKPPVYIETAFELLILKFCKG